MGKNDTTAENTNSKSKNKKFNGAVEVNIESKVQYPDFTFTYKSKGTAPRGDIIAIKAKSKNGKTFLASLLAAVTLGAEMKGFKASYKDSKVLYFDTEQNIVNTKNVVRRIYTMCEWKYEKNGRIEAYNLREMELDIRMDFIQEKITEFKPTAVFIDGIADLVSNFNDIDTSQALIQRLMKISSYNKCAIYIVIHTNKGRGDESMKGHLGTLAWQKCSDVFNIEKQKDMSFLVSESDCRNVPITKFCFKISRDGIPYLPKRLNEYIDEEEMYYEDCEEEDELEDLE